MLIAKRWEKLYHANNNCNRDGVTILIAEKVEFKKYYEKQGHFIIIRGSMSEIYKKPL